MNIDITPTSPCQPRNHAEGFAWIFPRRLRRSNIGGINQPVIGQKQIEHEIRLKEGEANLLGGMLEDQNTRSLSGIPGSGQIPILKYFFSQTNTEHSENEIVFVLIPHIVRGFYVDDVNEKAIDVGTATALQLNPVSESSSRAI